MSIFCAENSNVIYLCSIMLFYVFINKLFFKKTESLLFEKPLVVRKKLQSLQYAKNARMRIVNVRLGAPFPQAELSAYILP